MAVTIQASERKTHDFLKNHRVGVLATADPNGDPYAAAIYYALGDNFTIMFLTKTGTKKADNLEHNNHAMLVVYDAETQTTVQVMGSVAKITDADATNKVVSQIVYASVEASHTDIPPIFKLDEGDYVAYQLTPTQVRMAVFSQEKSGDYNALFKTIVPEHN